MAIIKRILKFIFFTLALLVVSLGYYLLSERDGKKFPLNKASADAPGSSSSGAGVGAAGMSGSGSSGGSGAGTGDG